MNYYNKEYLAHHGVLGQKWGVRRFQNADGSLTAKGKKHVANGKTINKVNKKHNFVDKDDVSISKRKDALDGVLASWGMTAFSSLGGGLMLAPGGPISALIGAGVMAAPFAITSAAATASFVKKDIAAKNADKKEKKFAEERAQNPIDKKTGFHKKTKEMTPEEDMERINPAYKNWDLNTKSNCVLCTMSYELRRRGYDVQAKKATSGYDGINLPKDWFPGAKSKESSGSLTDAAIIEMSKKGVPPKISKEGKKQMIESTISEVQSQKDGARGQLCLTWDGTFSGHSVAYENKGGKLVIYDTQSNEKFEDAAAVKYLNKCNQVSVMRLDNCDMNLKYIKEVAK